MGLCRGCFRKAPSAPPAPVRRRGVLVSACHGLLPPWSHHAAGPQGCPSVAGAAAARCCSLCTSSPARLCRSSRWVVAQGPSRGPPCPSAPLLHFVALCRQQGAASFSKGRAIPAGGSSFLSLALCDASSIFRMSERQRCSREQSKFAACSHPLLKPGSEQWRQEAAGAGRALGSCAKVTATELPARGGAGSQWTGLLC